MNYLKSLHFSKIIKYTSLFFIVFVICISIRVFLFEVYYVPSGSMENCLYEGDVILVSKIHYGARFPLTISDIPWINLFTSKSKVDSILFSNKRVKRISNIKKDDIVIFNAPNTKDVYNVKRCIALPHDTLLISNEIIQVNGHDLINSQYVKMKYRIKCLDRIYPFSTLMKVFSIPYSETRYQKVSSNKEVYLTSQQKEQIIRKLGDNIDIEHDTSFSYCRNIIMPYMGEIVSSLDSIPYEVFKHENISNKSIISQNYFFFLGDNRDVSIDSRYFGAIPENHIVGKVVLVLFSTNKSRLINDRRFFKFIN